MSKFDNFSDKALLDYVKIGTDDRIFAIAELMSRGIDLGVLCNATQIDMLFLDKIHNIVKFEYEIKAAPAIGRSSGGQAPGLLGQGDGLAVEVDGAAGLRPPVRDGSLPGLQDDRHLRQRFESYIPYFYSTYEEENESVVSPHKKIIVLGSGPIRIGQGVEFDYSTVHAVQTIKQSGYDAIIINNNPETVSTDYTCSDKLYFEPLTVEDVMNVTPPGAARGRYRLPGRADAINLAQPLRDHGVKIIGTDCDAIERG